MTKNIFAFYNRTPKLEEILLPLQNHIQNLGFSFVENYNEANIIVSIGGDSEFLQVVRKTGFKQDCLYAGLAIDKKSYFYCDFNIEDVEKISKALLVNSKEFIEVRKYPTIEVEIDKSFSFHCLNEVSIRSSIIKTISLDVFIDDLHFETFRGDGIVISTPTGSTGYNKSVNGAIVDPLLPCYQVSEIASFNNNEYRTLGSPFILSAPKTLLLKLRQDGSDYPIIGMDNEALSIQHIDAITIKLSDRTIKTIKLRDNSFWNKVQRKFL